MPGNHKRQLNSIRVIILTLEEMAPDLPSLPDTSDADMALMYLRHVEKHLGWLNPNEETQGDNATEADPTDSHA
jgi:hypothetical protein